MKLKKLKKIIATALFFLLVSAMLVACGDSPTATKSPTTAAATVAVTTAAPTTTAATTVAATTAAPTTVAATTAAPTTKAATTVAATTAATSAGTSALSLPAFANATEVSIPKEFNALLEKQLPGVKDAVIRIFGSSDDLATLTANVEKALTGGGYASGVPGVKGFEAQPGGTAFALFTKTGSLDLLMTATDISDQSKITSSLNMPGLSQQDTDKFVSQLKGQKSMLVIVGAKDLLNMIIRSNTPATPQATAAATTAAATTKAATTAASATTATTATGSLDQVEKFFNSLTDIPVDPAVTAAVGKAIPNAKEIKIEMGASDSDYKTAAKSLDQLMTTIGYTSARPSGALALDAIGKASIGGLYKMAGQPDVMLAVAELTPDFDQTVKNLDELQLPGLGDADLKKFFGQISGKKSFLVVISGKDLLKAANP